ncbi:hypothetical protein [Fodinicola feengrottensis]|uniref:hypothetical protein n=1 Tax=Fodinicola feengrottensis TaxID=435914 RepID=UPI0013D7A9E8|nr:hypothetical protein [Fodinicola feengrottensis]
MWDRVLTDAEIAASATEAVLVGRWGFDEGTGSTAAGEWVWESRDVVERGLD